MKQDFGIRTLRAEEFPSIPKEIIRAFNVLAGVVSDALAGGLTLADNIRCDVIRAPFDSGVAKMVGLTKLSTVGGGVCLSADGYFPLGIYVRNSSRNKIAEVTIMFNDSSATNVDSTVVLFGEGLGG
jgi:hypothetical protein